MTSALAPEPILSSQSSSSLASTSLSHILHLSHSPLPEEEEISLKSTFNGVCRTILDYTGFPWVCLHFNCIPLILHDAPDFSSSLFVFSATGDSRLSLVEFRAKWKYQKTYRINLSHVWRRHRFQGEFYRRKEPFNTTSTNRSCRVFFCLVC